MRFSLSIFVFVLYLFVLAGCSSTGKIETENTNPENGFSNVGSSSDFEDFETHLSSIDSGFFRKGHFIDVGKIKQVSINKTQDNVRQLLGEPELVKKSDKEWWFYNVDLPFSNQKDYIVCQYRVTFSEAKRVSETLWRRAVCQSRYASLLAQLPVEATPVKIVSLSSDILFQFDSAELTFEGKRELNKVIEITLRELDKAKLSIIGYTDRIGSDRYNLNLSQQRANTVSVYLQSQGISADNMITEGRGSRSPTVHCEGKIVNKELKACLAPDRRVQIIIEGER